MTLIKEPSFPITGVPLAPTPPPPVKSRIAGLQVASKSIPPHSTPDSAVVSSNVKEFTSLMFRYLITSLVSIINRVPGFNFA